MLEKPDLPEKSIAACLQEEYGLTAVTITFLPLGADVHTAVYRITAAAHSPYLLKLRKGNFDETAVILPKFLYDQGVKQIIPPLATQTGALWGTLDNFKTILYPFIAGHNGYEARLTDRHWQELGTALKHIHARKVPPALAARLRRETYSAQERDTVKAFLAHVETHPFDEPVAQETAVLLHTQRAQIRDLIFRAGQLAQDLQTQRQEAVVCHADLHAGNLLMAADGALYIIDWDEPILAPKERDLMYVGGGLLASGLAPEEEERRFYRTYGHVEINETALAYYRYERIIQDIAAYCRQLLLTEAGGEDRAQSFVYLRSNFLPNQTIEIAYWGDRTGLFSG